MVEDERAIADLVRMYLTRDGFGVHVESDGSAGLAAVRQLRPVVVVLDVGLPGMDGTEVCRRVRAEGDWTPVVFVTARDDEVDRILGLESGRTLVRHGGRGSRCATAGPGSATTTWPSRSSAARCTSGIEGCAGSGLASAWPSCRASPCASAAKPSPGRAPEGARFSVRLPVDGPPQTGGAGQVGGEGQKH